MPHSIPTRKITKSKQTPRRSAQSRNAGRLYGRRWQRARRAYLARFPLCKDCEKHGGIVGADVVDHVEPHRGDAGLFWDQKNWQPLCASCHSRKTAKQDGGYGNAKGAPSESLSIEGVNHVPSGHFSQEDSVDG